MGAVCAVVYLLTIIVFIPFPFYKDIVAATSGGGNRDVVLEIQEVEMGRFLHRFPHSKVCISSGVFARCCSCLTLLARSLSVGNPFPTICSASRYW
jgi:hypothetical protein